jgi:hypothetical protein
MRGKKSEYYEARVGESDVSLKRYKAHEQKGGRDAVPFPCDGLTHWRAS